MSQKYGAKLFGWILFLFSRYVWEVSSDVVSDRSNEDAAYIRAKRETDGILLWD